MGDGNSLLHVITARGEMSWQAFKNAFGHLASVQARDRGVALDDAVLERWRTRRALEGLGHCDFAFTEGRSVVIAGPAILALLPTREGVRAALVGGRAPEVVARTRHTCEAERCTLTVVEPPVTAPLQVPDSLIVAGDDMGAIAAVARTLGVRWNEMYPAWSLLHASASLDDYLARLTWMTTPDLNWRRRDFDPAQQRFVETRVDAPLRLSEYQDPVRTIRKYYLRRAGEATEVDVAWGRFAAARAAGASAFFYDRKRARLGVPSALPLPTLMHRALVLCFGRLPTTHLPSQHSGGLGQQRLDVYHEVPPQIAAAAAAKMGQRFSPHDIQIEGETA